MNLFVLPIVAEAVAPASGGSPLSFPILMLMLFGIMYFMMIRPQKRREKERREMIANLKKGDRVMLTSGILGLVSNVKEKTLIIRIADQTKIEVVKGAVSQVLEKGETPEDIEPSAR